MDDEWYELGVLPVAVIASICFYIYAIATYGWFLGGGLGWIPAIFLGLIVGFLWPLVVLAAVLWLGILAYALMR